MRTKFYRIATWCVMSCAVHVCATPVSYMSDTRIKIYQEPSETSLVIKHIGAGHIVQSSKEPINGFIPIEGGYAKQSNLLPFVRKEADQKSSKILQDNTVSTREIPVNYRGTVLENSVPLRACASMQCEIIGEKHKGDILEIRSKTADGTWYRSESPQAYISHASVVVDFSSSLGPNPAIKSVEPLLPHKEAFSDEVSETSIERIKNSSQKSNDALLAHSAELAQKYKNEAHRVNLTKTATPLPVKISARYARALDFPMLNSSGDVYTDYTYVWIKIKDEEFVLGKKEGSVLDNQFTIHKRVP